MMNEFPEFNIGDKIKQVYRGYSKTGVITKKYEGSKKLDGTSLTFYSIKWNDTGNEESGYLGNGLERI